MDFFIEFYEFSKRCELFGLKCINILQNLHTHNKIGGGGAEFYHRFVYIHVHVAFVGPLSDHSLLTFNLPFKVILRRVWGCFLMSAVRKLHFSININYKNSFKSTNTIVQHVYYGDKNSPET